FSRFALLVGMILMYLPFPSCNKPDIDRARFREILVRQLERYPAMEVQDLYKLLHQAALGPGHAIDDPSQARAWLEREITDLPQEPVNESQIDTLSAETGLVRVNLRPFLRSGGDPEELLTAFVRTANEYHGNSQLLECSWVLAIEMAEKGELPFSIEELREFFTMMKAQGFPAMHHSAAYRQAYRPAYRVLQPQFLSSPTSERIP
ncbi:MAG: hypothetical protein V3U62_08900, partial [Sedimenticolaceae bacterium]